MGPKANRFALLDIGGTKTRFAVTSPLQGGVLEGLATVTTPYNYSDFLLMIGRFGQSVSGDVSAVGVSFGVGLQAGVVRAASKMPDFVGQNIAADIGKILGAPATVHHDCICVLAGLSGRIADGECLGYVTVSTGVGAAVVTRFGEVFLFERIRIAHHVVDSTSLKMCACGRTGCLAAFIDASQLRAAGLKVEAIQDATIWNQYLDYLAIGLANFCRMFGLSRLFLGGGVMRNDYVKERIAQMVNQKMPDDGYKRTAVEILTENDSAPLFGAAAILTLSKAYFREY